MGPGSVSHAGIVGQAVARHHKAAQRGLPGGGRLVKHARYYWGLLAEGHLTRRLFGAMLRRIEALPLPTG